jgi:DNA-binding transcriptional ArsR family regulator
MSTKPTPTSPTAPKPVQPTKPDPFVVPATATRDYALDSLVFLTTPEQMKALSDRTRMIILDLLLERSATTSQLAEALGKPKGTVGYHLKNLEQHGLVKVVRTRKVRAMTEKYYGRTGRTFVLTATGPATERTAMLDEAKSEMVFEEGATFPAFTLRRMRLSEDRIQEFAKRLFDLTAEFVDQEPGGDTVYGLLAGIYPTDRPILPDAGDDERESGD